MLSVERLFCRRCGLCGYRQLPAHQPGAAPKDGGHYAGPARHVQGRVPQQSRRSQRFGHRGAAVHAGLQVETLFKNDLRFFPSLSTVEIYGVIVLLLVLCWFFFFKLLEVCFNNLFLKCCMFVLASQIPVISPKIPEPDVLGRPRSS